MSSLVLCMCFFPNFPVFMFAFRRLNFLSLTPDLLLKTSDFCCIPLSVISWPRYLLVCSLPAALMCHRAHHCFQRSLAWYPDYATIPICPLVRWDRNQSLRYLPDKTEHHMPFPLVSFCPEVGISNWAFSNDTSVHWGGNGARIGGDILKFPTLLSVTFFG